MTTPIFDSVMADQGAEVMPPPPPPTHEEFLARHQHEKFLKRAEAILSGKVKVQPRRRPARQRN